MRVPTLAVIVDGRPLTAAEAGLASAHVEVGLGAAHDRARLALSHLSPVAGAGPGSEVAVEIADTAVLTGFVDRVQYRPWGLVVDVLGAPAKLTTTYVGRSYLAMSAGDIVHDLLAEAGLAAGVVDNGPLIAAHHVDERRSAWQHVVHLARHSGHEVSTAADGGLNFTAAPGAGGALGSPAAAVAAAGSLLGFGGRRYGAELHDFSLGPTTVLASAPDVVAHGAGSELGADGWHVPVREPDGGPPAGPTLVPGLLRDRAGADLLGSVIGAAADRAATTGWLEVTGDPALRAGDTVDATDVPTLGSTALRIRRVTHRIGVDRGFLTRLEVEGAAA